MTTATKAEWVPMSEIKAAAEAAGSFWFEPATMRFFASRVGSGGYRASSGAIYFVSSEQFRASNGYRAARRYTVRKLTPGKLSINDVGGFQEYATGREATRAAIRACEADT